MADRFIRFQNTNRFHEYMQIVADKKGMTFRWMAEKLAPLVELKIDSRFIWNLSNRPFKTICRRDGLLVELAKLVGEPQSKLLFLCGVQPWGKRLSMPEQCAIWEFIEAMVNAKETGSPKPPAQRYTRLCNALFGGAEIVTSVDGKGMADFLRSYMEDTVENTVQE